jgi:predicted MFS family arabinose efflux permease
MAGSSAAIAAVLAHEGGWDEILLVGAPILVIIALLAVVKRRVDAQLPADDEALPD